VPIDVPEMWSKPAVHGGLLLRVLCYVEGDFVGTRIKGSAVGEDGEAGVPADCDIESRVVIPKVESWMGVAGGNRAHMYCVVWVWECSKSLKLLHV